MVTDLTFLHVCFHGYFNLNFKSPFYANKTKSYGGITDITIHHVVTMATK